MSEQKSKPVIVFRKAEEKDYEAVLDIDRNVYNGWDYLHHLYFEFLQDKNKWNVILEINGKVVRVNLHNLILINSNRERTFKYPDIKTR